MEGWTFRWESYWTPDRIKAFLDGVDVKDMVVFDMNSEYLPQYKKIAATGKRFIFGILPNYGSQNGLYGNVWGSVKGPQEARAEFPDLMVGIGTFMEGINENYIVYDSFYEMGWRKEMDVFDWVEHYSDWRYGKNAKLRLAWRQLMDTVYSPSQGGGHSVMAYEPRLNQRSRPTYIDVSLESLRLYQAAAKEMETLSNAFRYDYVDLAREVMVDLFAETNMMLRVALDRCIIMEKEFLVAKDTDSPGSDLGRVGDCGEGHPKKCDPQELIKLCEQTPDCVGFNMNGYLKSNTDTKTPCPGIDLYYRKSSFNNAKCASTMRSMLKVMPAIIKDTDRILGTSDSFLLGTWLRDARRKAKEVGGDASNFLFNAKNQITLWGPHGEINDYSTRQWNGVVGDYQYVRWTEYLKTVAKCVFANATLDLGDYHERMMKFGLAWAYDDAKQYIEKAEGNFLEVGQYLLEHYFHRSGEFAYHSDMTGAPEGVYFTSVSRDVEVLSVLCLQ
ncbi:hypothetical protein WA577_003530, partial [Blastocystis sp. JDR]